MLHPPSSVIRSAETFLFRMFLRVITGDRGNLGCSPPRGGSSSGSCCVCGNCPSDVLSRFGFDFLSSGNSTSLEEAAAAAAVLSLASLFREVFEEPLLLDLRKSFFFWVAGLDDGDGGRVVGCAGARRVSMLLLREKRGEKLLSGGPAVVEELETVSFSVECRLDSFFFFFSFVRFCCLRLSTARILRLSKE